jgi:hypothetical protein
MKKLLSLLLAVASTMFLFVGATQAAEKFDTIGNGKSASLSSTLMEGPGLPCVTPDDN